MTPNEYQELAMRTANPDQNPSDAIVTAALGLTGESGEFADRLKKWFAQGHEFDRDGLIKELGDVQWYIALAADSLGTTIEAVMERNILKLRERYPNGFDPGLSVNRPEES